ncbi:LysR family transcriptional regulator [Derxia gummosa]|uniref:LysR family transcriptional regulator n=1 Tax=Derxia gummosa DSM 723 TaxID=1121388 RepID=A0A8B6X5E9_9BURK|nr:LysR family transcriptional regulator [Derxia gummosa]
MSIDHLAPLLADIHLLTVLGETRSFTQAARRLKLSKASVSARIAELERAVGLPLVRRTTRSVALTDAGRRLAEDSAPAFARVGATLAEVIDLAGEPRGLLRVTAPVALGRQHLAPTLADFCRAHPAIQVELDLSDRLSNLAQEGFDLALRHTHAPPDTHVAWELCETRTLLVASPAYLAARGEPEAPGDLAGHACIGYLREGAMTWAFERVGADGRIERRGVTVAGPIRANNSEVLRAVVADGLAIGLLPDFSAASELAAGRLVRVLADWTPVGGFGPRLYALRPWSPQVPRAVRVFVEHLKAHFAGGFGG